jgi:hypothetical protein
MTAQDPFQDGIDIPGRMSPEFTITCSAAKTISPCHGDTGTTENGPGDIAWSGREPQAMMVIGLSP